MMDLESASALVRTLYTVPLLVVTVVVVGAVLVRRRPARRRHAPSPPPTGFQPADLTPWAGHQPPSPTGPPGPRADRSGPPGQATPCAERGHDLTVDHDPRTGQPATIRCVAPSCGASWDAVPDPAAPRADRSDPPDRAPGTWRAHSGTGRQHW